MIRSATTLEDGMKRSFAVLSLALAALPVTACVEDGYGYGGITMGGVYTYDGYYDDYYGPIYDGYWGSNGYFYYRRGEQERNYSRGSRDHFRRGPDVPQGGRFRRFQGNTRPPQGTRMPHFDGAGRHGGDRPPRQP